ncbi:MAG: hypothetical protein L0H70_02690 [Xanthomonadales bacterium]|nr:hypothetical protein [Xanthomonadales bacterium]
MKQALFTLLSRAALVVALALAAIFASTAATAQVSVPNTFVANTPAKASEVNANFTALVNAINTLQATVTTQQQTIASLQTQLAALGNVAALNDVVELDQVTHSDSVGNSATYPTVVFHGVNVQVVNGMGSTATTNGLGNLIIGYNASNIAPVSQGGEHWFCSDGGYNADANACTTHGTWASDQRSGSHNLILGDLNAYSQYGGLVVGNNNIINNVYATVTGGTNNIASGGYASVSGGAANAASGTFAAIGGGGANVASGYEASISGGRNNNASNTYTAVSGGYGNSASGYAASVSGGNSNTATGDYSTVCGGVTGNATVANGVVCP